MATHLKMASPPIGVMVSNQNMYTSYSGPLVYGKVIYESPDGMLTIKWENGTSGQIKKNHLSIYRDDCIPSFNVQENMSDLKESKMPHMTFMRIINEIVDDRPVMIAHLFTYYKTHFDVVLTRMAHNLFPSLGNCRSLQISNAEKLLEFLSANIKPVF
jgi:hypothetical protein